MFVYVSPFSIANFSTAESLAQTMVYPFHHSGFSSTQSGLVMTTVIGFPSGVIPLPTSGQPSSSSTLSGSTSEEIL